MDFPESPLLAAQKVRDGSSSVIPCIVMKNDGILYDQRRHFLLSHCDYDLFAKVK